MHVLADEMRDGLASAIAVSESDCHRDFSVLLTDNKAVEFCNYLFGCKFHIQIGLAPRSFHIFPLRRGDNGLVLR
jgi:hypothetical protein